jgi:hypothetical protein
LAAALVFPAVLLLCLPQVLRRPATVWPLLTLPISIAVLYVGLHAVYAWGFGEDVSGISVLAAQAMRWYPVLRLTLHLVAAGFTGLLASFAQRPPAYPGPLAPLLPALAVVLVLVAGWRSDARGRRYLLAFTVLALGGYGMIAAGRAIGTLAILGQSAATTAGTPRYHYLQTAVLSALLCIALGRVTPVRMAERWKATLLAAAVAVGALLYLTRAKPIDHHEMARRETGRILDFVRKRVEAQPPGQRVYIENHPFASVALFMGRFQLPFPGWAAIFIIFHPSGVLDGREVYFVSRDPRILESEKIARRPFVIGPEQLPPNVSPL